MQEQSKRAFLKKTDVIVIAVLICISLGIWGYVRINSQNKQSNANAIYAVISNSQGELKRVNLSEGVDQDFSVDGYPQVVFHQYPDESIIFKSSDCPDQVCVQFGKLKRIDDFAACLPNDLFVYIVGNDELNSVSK